MEKKKTIMSEIREWLIIIIIAVAVALLIDSQVFARVTVEQSSMENTLFENHQLIVEKVSYKFSQPKTGDIIIFLKDAQSDSFFDDLYISINGMLGRLSGKEKYERLVKRVIGASGDVVDIKDGAVYVNGNMLQEPYVHALTDSGYISYPVTVGENELFVLGDNREVSIDSRAFGPIDMKQVEGKAILRIYPFDKMGKIE